MMNHVNHVSSLYVANATRISANNDGDMIPKDAHPNAHGFLRE